MAKFIKLPSIGRINVDHIESYETDSTNPHYTNIYMHGYGGSLYKVELPVEDIDRLIEDAGRDKGVLSSADKDTIERFRRTLDEFKNALGRIPTSIRMHW